MTRTRQFLVPVVMTATALVLFIGVGLPSEWGWSAFIVTALSVLWLAALDSWQIEKRRAVNSAPRKHQEGRGMV